MKLVIDGVSKQYKSHVWGLRDFSLEMKPGILGLLGPNGAGKTTLMNILATVTRPTAGKVTWNGTNIAKSPDELRADVLGRVRRYSFLIVIGVTLYAGYMMLPSMEAPYNAFVIGGYRGVYNSAWAGTVFGVVVSTLLTVLTFILVALTVMALIMQPFRAVSRIFRSQSLLSGQPFSAKHFFGTLLGHV